MNSPIALFVYNRPEHTARTLDALASALDAESSPVVIFADGAKSAADAESVAAVHNICKQKRNFASQIVVEREKNMGLAQNIISGVTKIFEKYETVVVLEDDIVVSPYFIRYINSALSFYDNRGIFSISGYTPNIDIPHDYASSTYVMHRNCSWGWATWRAKWQKVDWSVAAFGSFIRNAAMRDRFDESGCDLTPMLLRQQTGEINSWSIRFCFAGFMAGEPTVYPVRSLVKNIGVDGSGTNMKSSFKYDTSLASKIDVSTFTQSVAPNLKIQESFKAFYDCSPVRRLINFFKIRKFICFHRRNH